MSRLDSFIRRMMAQRAVLDWATGEIASKPGLVLEIGLGNGRTFDHLREKLPNRPIYAFDRADNAHPASKPPADWLVLGEFSESLPAFAQAHPHEAVLLHYDAGLGDTEANREQLGWISDLLPRLAMPGAIVLSDQALENPALQRREPPVDIPKQRYFLYQMMS
ncbi:class I SAM-dependent methyltransferase [Ferrovibrio sp.]|uniref:class I SAM-dependent methyltransferase n=1 Tax=Ferrovibrio sp. TaxID=1917215 RepID=UPI0025C6D68C|nr:class I SAM-dependent methyltransferase [Ferrovibrio sp.]MBX3454155.1 hypothetical protein [Ferrovibrio sp.]